MDISTANSQKDPASIVYNDFKYVNDPIHGHIRLDSSSLAFIDTEHFQRLRDLRQVGALGFVFPGANHSRFEHSIGVYHLCEKMLDQLKLNHSPSVLEVREEDEFCVKIAGLCHDLGHGPFSHLFDNEFIPLARPGCIWSHEDGSKMLFNDLIDTYSIDLGTDQVKLINDLIEGDSRSIEKERGWLYDIVANKRNSVDVDKFDYLARDCYYAGFKSSYDSNRIILNSRVIDNQVCFSSKDAYNLYALFHTRYTLFKNLYTHRCTKAIEYMIVDALLDANSVLKFSDMIDDPKEYIGLTDAVIREIERSKDERLQSSRKIIKRIRERDIYKFVDEYYYGPEEAKGIVKKTEVDRIKSKILGYSSGQFSLDDVIVEVFHLNYSMKDKNPVDNIKFYGKYHENVALPIEKEKISILAPLHFQETVCRIFSRDASKVSVIQKAFRTFLRLESHNNKLERSSQRKDGEGDSTPWNSGWTIPQGFSGSPRKRQIASAFNSNHGSPVKRHEKDFTS